MVHAEKRDSSSREYFVSLVHCEAHKHDKGKERLCRLNGEDSLSDAKVNSFPGNRF